ncbi:MAG: hypothetical protein Q7T07_06815 [Burkholderiaceae bacterium]|nr:hypothetical protein [Burkholderiaceae bacterium]
MRTKIGNVKPDAAFALAGAAVGTVAEVTAGVMAEGAARVAGDGDGVASVVALVSAITAWGMAAAMQRVKKAQ